MFFFLYPDSQVTDPLRIWQLTNLLDFLGCLVRPELSCKNSVSLARYIVLFSFSFVTFSCWSFDGPLSNLWVASWFCVKRLVKHWGHIQIIFPQLPWQWSSLVHIFRQLYLIKSPLLLIPKCWWWLKPHFSWYLIQSLLFQSSSGGYWLFVV